ncbi:hypothetical protein [Mesorhizobium sp.]|nr:hypothetical protein [Mesorhizobium sp.]RWG44160.1 MAG: hypothetical protein EOQ62_21755 [Mesorhizobium sp.]
MSSAALTRELENIDRDRLAKAREAFLSVDKAFTIRRRQVVGEAQFEQRLTRAIAAYLAGSAI